MNRTDLQELARQRLRDARVLLRHGRYAGAYYLAGYAVECALKACIAKQTRRHDFPDKNAVTKTHTHDLSELVRLAGLKSTLDKKAASDKAFELNWGLVKDWEASDRYNTSLLEADAADLYSAIAARRNGVMTWLRSVW